MNLLQIHPFHMSSECVYHTTFMCPRDDERGEQLEIWTNQPTKMHLDEAGLNSVTGFETTDHDPILA